jgi:hypothetical protein
MTPNIFESLDFLAPLFKGPKAWIRYYRGLVVATLWFLWTKRLPAQGRILGWPKAMRFCLNESRDAIRSWWNPPGPAAVLLGCAIGVLAPLALLLLKKREVKK